MRQSVTKLLFSIALMLGAAQCANAQALTAVADSNVSLVTGKKFTGKICFMGPNMVYGGVTYTQNTQPGCIAVTNGVFPSTTFVPNGVDGVVTAGDNDLYTALWQDASGKFLRSEIWVIPPTSSVLKIYQVQKNQINQALTYSLTTKGDDVACCGTDGFSVRVPVGANNTVKVADSTNPVGWAWKPVTTDLVTEGSGLYFTNSRARAAFNASAPLVYNASTGAYTCPSCATGSGVQYYNIAFSSTTTVAAPHTLNSLDLLYTCYDGSNFEIQPNDFHAVDLNNAAITFSTNQTGRCVIVAAGTTGSYVLNFTNQTNLTLQHNKNTLNVIANCYGSGNFSVEPNTEFVQDVNTVLVTFTTPQSGRCVVNGG